jgi:hypothetical protein
MAPEVFFTVCYRFATDDVRTLKKLHDFKPAILHGYRRSRVAHADYPGVLADAEHEVRGTYVTNITATNLYHLDRFEGDDYERRTVRVSLLSKVGNDKGEGNVEGDQKECSVYVFLDPAALEGREWDFEEFRTTKMKNWTREDYGFDDADRFAPKEDDGVEPLKAAV